MVRFMRFALPSIAAAGPAGSLGRSAVGVFLLLMLLAGCPGGGFECECFPCGSAIDLRVFDADGQALIEAWQVEAQLDGEVIDTTACLPENRGTSNACGFGLQVGVYDIVVRTPSVEKSVRGRFSSRVGQDCCGCLTGEIVNVILEN